MNDQQPSSWEWIRRIALGVLLGNILLAIVTFLATMLWYNWSSATPAAAVSFQQGMTANDADAFADNMDAMADDVANMSGAENPFH